MDAALHAGAHKTLSPPSPSQCLLHAACICESCFQYLLPSPDPGQAGAPPVGVCACRVPGTQRGLSKSILYIAKNPQRSLNSHSWVHSPEEHGFAKPLAQVLFPLESKLPLTSSEFGGCIGEWTWSRGLLCGQEKRWCSPRTRDHRCGFHWFCVCRCNQL